MPIIVKPGEFKPSDPFGFYQDRPNPLAPQPVDPAVQQREAQIAQAQTANAQVEQDFQQLEAQAPGRYELVDDDALDAWRSDWEARQPGWLEDVGRMLGGGLAKGSGMVVGGLGEAVRSLGNASTTPIINSMFGTDYGQSNTLDAPAEWLNTLGQKTQQGVSFATRDAIAKSSPGGDLLDPGTWTLGEDPSLVGYTALALDVFGQMVPVLAASVALGPEAGAVVGGLQGGGAAAQQAEQIIDEMAAEPGVLERESAFYREQIAAGKSHEQALAATRAAAAQTAFLLTAPISGLGGYATGRIIDPANAVLAGKNIVARLGGRAGLSALEEGSQEAAETMATNAGINVGAGTDIDVSNGTFADFLLGALGGATPGAVAGGVSEAKQALGGLRRPAPPQGAAAPSTPADGPPVAVPATSEPRGPLGRAVEAGLAATPRPTLIINDPALPGMGAGPGHGQAVQLALDQGGVDPSMARVVLEDGSERIVGKRLLQTEDGQALAPDPQATQAPLRTGPRVPGLPAAGQRVIVRAEGLPEFNATIEQFVEGDDGALEAVIADDDGEVLQVPVSALSSLNLTREQIAEMERAENPPAAPMAAPEGSAPRLRTIPNAKGEPASIIFPDETLAGLYDLGSIRARIKRLNRATGQGDALRMQDFAPDRVAALADALGVTPERVNEIADDYRYRTERAARKATAEAVTNMHGLAPDRLKGWQAERQNKEVADPVAASLSAMDTQLDGFETEDQVRDAVERMINAGEGRMFPDQEDYVVDQAVERWKARRETVKAPTTVAPVEQSTDEAWWDGLTPGARKALLTAAGVKRSEKTAWARFSKPIKAKLAPLRVEMEGLDKARARSRSLDVAVSSSSPSVEAEDSTEQYQRWEVEQRNRLEALENGTEPLTADDEAEIVRIATALAEQRGYPDEVDFIAERAVERARANRSTPRALDVAAEEAATSPSNDLPEPSQAQKEAGNYKMGHAMLGGLDLSIENPAGSERKGTDKGGKAWSVTMKSHYGYIKGTVGKDKDHVDVFVRPGVDELTDADPVFVVDQVNADGAFDEHKVMLGFADEAAARAAYLENYTKGWKGLGALTETTLGEFKQWLQSGGTTRPFGKLPARPKAKPAAPAAAPAKNLQKKSANLEKSAPPPAASGRFEKNKLFTANKVEAARARLRTKLGQLNSGVDPEVLIDGMTIAGAYIEAGIRDFSEYAAQMTADFGDRIKPYLLSFWEGARNYPGLDAEGMTDPAESARLHKAMLEPLPVEEAPALGQELARPKKRTRKTGRPGDRTLVQDFGVEHIDGWADPDGTGEETDSGVRGGVKTHFLNDAAAYLKAVAAELTEQGYAPPEDNRGRAMKPIAKTEAGPAVSGEVTLSLWHPDSGVRLHAVVSGSALRNTVPSTRSGTTVMFRAGVETDRYATGTMNQWAPVDLSAADLAALMLQHAARVVAASKKPRSADDRQRVITDLKAVIARPPLAPEIEADNGNDSTSQQRVDGGTGDRMGPDAGPAEPRPQPDLARADTERLASGQSSDVEAAAESGSRRPAGAGGAAADVGGAGEPDGGRDAGDRRPRTGGARPSDAGAGERPAGGAGTGLATRKAPETVSPGNPGPGNFHIDDPLAIVGGGQVARFERNKQAIALFNVLRDEGRQATREEQAVLAGYTGWGSFGQDLFQGTWANPRPKAGWEARDAWLREQLGQDEWESLQRSITNAHYTDPPTVQAMWSMVRRMGFAGGRVLEPSMGIGNFFGLMPPELAVRSSLTGIELDAVTGGMAKLLYPGANISVMGYQESRTSDDFYDLVIGNWPFENTTIADRRYNRLSPFLHDYFYLKAVDQVRPGGLVVGITSKGTLDKKDSTIRTALAKKAELVAAFRLPTGAFEGYAGTAVVTDIIILRKRDEALGMAADAGWIKSVPFQTPQGEEVSLNEYFVAHPDHVVGRIEYGSHTTFRRPGMIVTRPADMEAQLARIAALVPEDGYRPDSRAQDSISYITNHTDDREGALVKTDDGLFIVRGEHLAPAAEIAKYAVKDAKVTDQRVAQLEALVEMRRAYAELIAAERGATGDPEAARTGLRRQYDGFVAAHGNLSDSFGLSYLRKIEDPFWPALAALEKRDGKSIAPATILTRSTIRVPRKIDKPSVSDAFVLARNQAINPSLEQIAEIAQKPAETAKAELIEKGAVFELPGGDIVPSDIYLSGNVREKMRQARAALDAGNTAMQRNVDALTKVMPPDVPYYDIEVQMGASWVPTQTYADYIAHMLNAPDAEGITVSYTAGRWRITLDPALKARPEASAGFGTPEYSFQKLVNAAISNQTVTIRREDPVEKTTYVDQEATAEVNDKIASIRSSFGDWLWSDLDRRVALEAEYNEVRNAYASPSYDGSFLTFEGMALSLGSGPFDLREHQANAIWRALVTRRSLNAHEVGTGKTFTMGGIAVESRRYGIARKPLIFAHNANSASVAAEISQMYPAAKVLYIDNLTPAQIDVKLRQIANDDWDAVVVPHSLISRFSLTEETLMALAAEEIAAIESEAYAAAEDDGVELTDAMLNDEEALKKLRSPTAKDLVKTRNRIIENIKKQSQRASREGALSFEELGVDQILVDEVHEFKKPPFSTRMRMKGLNTQSSDRSIALSFLLHYIRANNNGGNVHLFTGTPVTNTLTEVFHAMRYIMAEEMAEASVDQWDGWFGSFAREVQDVELNAAAEYEAVNRLAGFINVPELRRMIGQYMDVVFADDMPEMQPRPSKSGKILSDPALSEKERAELLNGRTEGATDRPYKKVIVETADLTPAQERAFREIQADAQRWRQMTAKEKRETMLAGGPESPIIVESRAARASFDVRLLDGERLAGQEGQAADDPQSKASRVVRNVTEIYRSHPKATQVIFTNAGLSKVGTRSVGEVGAKRQERFKVFSTVGDIVERLVQSGIPRAEIAVVDGSTSKEKRKQIADAMNRAEIRVTIGSTQSLGVGVNMQRNLRAMHHMDAPWMPGDLEQRNGRGQRQGNAWNTVLEYRYLTDRIDGRRWQILAVKQRFINAFLKSDDKTRVIEGDAASDEESDILTTFAEAAGDPRVLIREKLRKKVEQMKKRQRLHDNGVVDARRSADRLVGTVEKERARATRLEPIAAKVAAISSEMAGDGFAITVAGRTYDKRGDAREALDALAEDRHFAPGMEPQDVGSFGGAPLKVIWPRLRENWSLVLTVDGEEIGGRIGSLASLESRLRGYSEEVASILPAVADTERSIDRLRAQAKEPFHQAADLERAEADLEALENDLTVNPVPPPAWLRSGAPIETEVIWKGEKRLVSGHRWNDRGWFVLTSGAAAPIEMPYLEVEDEQGMPIYEQRAFVPPEVVEAGPSTGKASRKAAVATIKGDELNVAFHGPEDMPALRRAAAEWYDTNLVGATATMRDGTEVRFNKRGRRESTQGRKGDILLRAVPAIKAIIEQGEVVLREPGNRPSVTERIVLRAPVNVMGQVRMLVVSVHQTADGRYHYDFNMDREGEGPGVGVPGRLTRQSLVEVGLEGALVDINIGEWAGNSKAATSIAGVRAALQRGGLGTLVDNLEKAGRLKIVEAHDTPDYVQGAQGWTDPDGTITLVADQIESDPAAVLLHEAFHSGAADLLGSRQWRRLMVRLAGLFRQFEHSKGRARQFYDAARERVRAAEAAGDQLTEGLRIEEFAAYAIEEHTSAPAALAKWVDDVLGAVKAWMLRRFGRQVGRITPGQLAAIARYALSAASGTSAQPVLASRRKSVAASRGLTGIRLDKTALIDRLSGTLTDLKPSALAALPLNYFAELKRPGMVAVDQYLKVKRLMDTYRGDKHARIDALAQEWRKYARLGLGGADAAGRTRAAALADLMHESTLAGIDPSATDEETVAKPGYAELRAKFTALPRSGQDLYRKVRDAYRDQADELDMILLDNVRKTQEIAFRRAEDKYRDRLAEIAKARMSDLDRSKAEKDAQDTYQAEMRRATYNMKARMTKMRMAFEASRVPAPYFPLARFGRYFVTVRDIEGNVLSFSRRETDAERRKLERDMKAAYPNANVESGLLSDSSSARDMMDPRIVAEIETLLGDQGVDSRVMDMIWQRYLETMPDLSARKRFIHRKGVAGFDGDALRTFASNQFHAAHQMARLKYGIELSELANQAADQAKKADDPVRGMQLANELAKRHEWVMNPTGSRAVQAVTSAMFTWYLAASPAAAMVNMAQTPMLAIPVLGARLGGLGKASAAIGRAAGDVLRGRGSALHDGLTADERQAMAAFYESGLIDRTQAHDLAGIGERGLNYSPLRAKVMAVISYLYHQVEVWNREITALAAYRLARAQGNHHGRAIDLAHELTWKSHFDYSNSSRPRMMQGDFAKMALTFQSYQVNMWYRLFRDIHQSFKGESTQARKEARYQLAGIMGMMALFSGVSGLFGYNVLMALLGLAFDDDDDPRTFRQEFEGSVLDLFGKDLGGIILKGAPGHLAGIDLTSRLGMADFFVRAPDNGAEGKQWFQELMVGALGVVPSTILSAIDGFGLIGQGNWARGIEVMAPKAIKDSMQAYRYMNEGLLTRRGDVVLERDQLSPLDALVEMVGFTPARVAETYERNRTLKDAEQRVLDERRELMNRFALAVRLGDLSARQVAIDAIKAWNRKPYARAVPITGDSLRQSLKARARNAAKREDGVLIPDRELSHFLRELMPNHVY